MLPSAPNTCSNTATSSFHTLRMRSMPLGPIGLCMQICCQCPVPRSHVSFTLQPFLCATIDVKHVKTLKFRYGLKQNHHMRTRGQDGESMRTNAPALEAKDTTAHTGQVKRRGLCCQRAIYRMIGRKMVRVDEKGP